MSRLARVTLVTLTGVLGAATTVQGGHRDAGCERPRWQFRSDADIEELFARLAPARRGWTLFVGFEVKIDRAHPAERFELVLSLTTSCGAPVRDDCGRPVVVTRPLIRRPGCDGRSVLIGDAFQTRLSPGGGFCANDLRVRAQVVRCNDGRVLDREVESVRVHRFGGR